MQNEQQENHAAETSSSSETPFSPPDVITALEEVMSNQSLPAEEALLVKALQETLIKIHELYKPVVECDLSGPASLYTPYRWMAKADPPLPGDVYASKYCDKYQDGPTNAENPYLDALEVACAYVAETEYSVIIKRFNDAWHALSKANAWIGNAWGAMTHEYLSRVNETDVIAKQGGRGGNARAAKYTPIKEYVYRRYKDGRYKNYSDAGNLLKDEVIAYANREHGVTMTPSSTQQTIAKWLTIKFGEPSKKALRGKKALSGRHNF
jgi:hypothetical protein